MPNVRAVHIDRPLTNLSIRYANAAFIGETLFPPIKVKKESDVYFIYGKEHYQRQGTLRAVGAESNEYEWTVSTSSYTAEEYALKAAVADRERANADVPLSLDIDTNESLREAIGLDWEIRYQTLAALTASFASGNTATPAIKWDQANAIIQTDILLGQETVRRAVQRYPNTIIIPARVAMYVALDSTIQDLIKYTHSNLLLGKPGSWLLPPMLWGMKVIVPGSTYNTANEAAAESLSDIWSDTVILAYVNPSPGIKRISWGYTFQPRNWRTKKWREEARESDIIEVSVLRDAKVTCTGCAYRLNDCLNSE